MLFPTASWIGISLSHVSLQARRGAFRYRSKWQMANLLLSKVKSRCVSAVCIRLSCNLSAKKFHNIHLCAFGAVEIMWVFRRVSAKASYDHASRSPSIFHEENEQNLDGFSILCNKEAEDTQFLHSLAQMFKETYGAHVEVPNWTRKRQTTWYVFLWTYSYIAQV